MSELSEARAKAARARADLLLTAHELQQRLTPATLAENAMESAKRKGSALAGEAASAISRRPVTAGAAVAGVTAFLGFNLFKRFFKRPDDEDED
jgi:hypothetical protein